jgi:hypothetical protein
MFPLDVSWTMEVRPAAKVELDLSEGPARVVVLLRCEIFRVLWCLEGKMHTSTLMM